MTIYGLLYVMDNQLYDVVIHNDAFIDDGRDEIIRGDICDITNSYEYDEFQYEEVTDVYTEANGTIHICFNNEDY